MAPSNQNILSIQAFLCSFGDFWLRWLVHMAARRGNFYYAQFCIFTRSSIYFRFYFFFFFCSIAAVDMGFRIYFPLFNILVCFRFHSLYWFGKFCTLHAYLCCDALSPGRYFSLFFFYPGTTETDDDQKSTTMNARQSRWWSSRLAGNPNTTDRAQDAVQRTAYGNLLNRNRRSKWDWFTAGQAATYLLHITPISLF